MNGPEALQAARAMLKDSSPETHRWIARTTKRITPLLQGAYHEPRGIAEMIARLECMRAYAVSTGETDAAETAQTGIDDLLSPVRGRALNRIRKFLNVVAE